MNSEMTEKQQEEAHAYFRLAMAFTVRGDEWQEAMDNVDSCLRSLGVPFGRIKLARSNASFRF